MFRFECYLQELAVTGEVASGSLKKKKKIVETVVIGIQAENRKEPQIFLVDIHVFDFENRVILHYRRCHHFFP